MGVRADICKLDLRDPEPALTAQDLPNLVRGDLHQPRPKLIRLPQ